MRLRQYLVKKSDIEWDTIIKTIKRDCKQYLKIVGKNVFYRAVDRNDTFFEKKSRLVNRKPMHTRKWVHDLWNECFEELLGWKARNGVFVAGNVKGTYLYGDGYIFFAKGSDIKFVFSPIIDDLYAQQSDILKKYGYEGELKDLKKTPEKLKPMLINFIKKYYFENKQIKKASKCDEVMWKCDSYYLVNVGDVEDEFGNVNTFMKGLRT